MYTWCNSLHFNPLIKMTQFLLRKSLVCMCMYVNFDTIIYSNTILNKFPTISNFQVEILFQFVFTFPVEIDLRMQEIKYDTKWVKVIIGLNFSQQVFGLV